MHGLNVILVAILLRQASSARLVMKGAPPGSPVVPPTPTKVIAGVPIFNYDVAFKPERAASFLQGVKGEKVEGREHFVIMLKQGLTNSGIVAVCDAAPQCTVHGHSSGVPYMEFKGTEAELEEFVKDFKDQISFVEPDMPVAAIPEKQGREATSLGELGSAANRTRENGWSWGLSRIGIPEGGHPDRNGAGVHVYVLDTGVRASHIDFEGRAVPTLEFLGSAVPCNGNYNCAVDRQGHGTHTAGTIGGKRLGVAPGATLHAVKVLGDSGSGSVLWALGALDWVLNNAMRPAVVSMSLGAYGIIQAEQAAIRQLTNAGITVVVAAGNDASDACGESPAFVPEAITVGATDEWDGFASYSNYGRCVNILAPGSDIRSLSNSADDMTTFMSGTSMACPHVAGAAALLLQENPSLTPPQVLQRLQDHAFQGSIYGDLGGSPNMLLRSPGA